MNTSSKFLAFSILAAFLLLSVIAWNVVYMGWFKVSKSASSELIIDIENILISECTHLVATLGADGNARYIDRNIWPPTVRKLKPQAVSLRRAPEGMVVDIQLQGGFNHRGIIVVVPPVDPETVNAPFTSCKIHEKIIEYKE